MVGAAAAGGPIMQRCPPPTFFPGEALLGSGVPITAVYSSPALRCVQTAEHILGGQ